MASADDAANGSSADICGASEDAAFRANDVGNPELDGTRRTGCRIRCFPLIQPGQRVNCIRMNYFTLLLILTFIGSRPRAFAYRSAIASVG